MRRHLPTAVLSVMICTLLFGTSGIAQKSAARGRPGGGVDTRSRQTRPIELGTSGGNATDLANGYCCSGTLGALVGKGNTLYILSNTHVLAGDSVAGGNGTVSGTNDPVNQPGLVDVGCANISSDYVARVSDWAVLGSKNIDAAVAQIDPGDVDPSGAILGIGTLSSSPASTFIGQAVKKTGRTTGLSRSSVSGLNATVNIAYSTECAGTSYNVQYTGQILIENRGSKFLAAGDSGSLMVEDIASNPRAVGLLYAGSSTIAIANPIQDVLSGLGISIVGTTVSATSGTGAAEGKNAGANAQGLIRAMEVQSRNAGRLMAVPGAVGHAVGVGNSPLIKVLVEELTPGVQAAAPVDLEGVPVIVEEVGQLRALPVCKKK
jgi:hypothetical protein